MEKKNNSMLLVGFSIFLSLAALIGVAALRANPAPTTTTVMMPAAHVAAAAAPTQSLNVVMHDPGCHWFQTDAGLKLATTIKGPVNLHNMDEAALRIVGPS